MDLLGSVFCSKCRLHPVFSQSFSLLMSSSTFHYSLSLCLCCSWLNLKCNYLKTAFLTTHTLKKTCFVCFAVWISTIFINLYCNLHAHCMLTVLHVCVYVWVHDVFLQPMSLNHIFNKIDDAVCLCSLLIKGHLMHTQTFICACIGERVHGCVMSLSHWHKQWIKTDISGAYY